MHTHKRVLSFIMALVMVMSLLPVQVFAAEEAAVPKVGYSEENVITASEGPHVESVANGELEFTFSDPVTWFPDYEAGEYGEYYFMAPENTTGSFQLSNKSASNLVWNAEVDESCDVENITVDGVAVGVEGITVYPGSTVTIAFTMTTADGYLLLKGFNHTVATAGNVQLIYDSSLGVVTVNGVEVESGAMVSIPDTGVAIEATPKSGAGFIGWVNPADHTYKSAGSIPKFTVGSEQTVVEAAFTSPDAKAWFYAGRNNAYLYDDLGAAVVYAKTQTSYNMVTLAADGKLVKDTYDIPSGVKLLIPRNEDDGGTFGTVASGTTTKYGASQKAFRILKVENEAVLNFQSGSQLNVNGAVYDKNGSFSGVTTDTYGCIDLGTDAQINLNSNTQLYCYGYIIGDGKVVANEGATVYEVFQTTGWRGGTATTLWSSRDDISSFAVNDFAVQNIEADLVVCYGATVGVSATINAGGVSRTPSETYIGKYENGKGSGLLQLESGASLHRQYNPENNRMQYILYGNAHMASMDLSVWLLFSQLELNTSDYILAIPYYWDFVAKEGSVVTLHNDYKILPGATLTVEEGATAIIAKDSHLYVYDTKDYVGKSFTPSGNSVPVRYVATTGETAGSLPKMNSATASGQVFVNGTLQIDGAMYVTENGGTSVDKVVKGNGTIINNSNANAAVTNVLDEFRYDSTEKKIVDYNINVIPAVGQIAGVSLGESYHNFAKDTYYGAGNGYWYQHIVSTSDFESIKDFKNIPAEATAALDRQRILIHQGTKIENVLGFVSSYMNITEAGAEVVTTPFTFTVNSLVEVTGDENSILTGKGTSIDPYVLTITQNNTVLSTGAVVAGENEILMRYDDHLDMTGKNVEIINAGAPESYQVGYGIEVNAVKDTAVVTMEGKFLVATGIGEAVVTVDGVEKVVKVSAAPISMLFLGGQSNMQGSRGEGKQSIVIPDGMSYLTYGERYSMTTKNATTYAPSALTGEYRNINVEGTESGLSMFPVNTFEAKIATNDTYGKDGPDSGFALQWIESTGEKVWVINAAHGGSSIDTWLDGTSNYEEAVLLFKACMETMQKEIAAGHYTLSHMGFYWCQGCTDSGKSAEWYAPKFIAMYDAMKEDLSMDMDSNPETPDQTLEFANIVLTVAGHMTTTGYRFEEGVYTSGDGKGFTTVEDLEMRGQRVAQLWLGANPEYPDINVVSNLVDTWITMPDGTDGVEEYFQKYYPDGVINYTPQEAKSESWYKPTDANDVRASDSPIHYNQLGYNEMGREAVRNTMYLLGYAKDPADVETEVTFYDWTGFREVTEISAETKAQSSTLVVPVVYPIYRSKDVSYSLSDGLSYNYYDLTAQTTMTSGTLTAIGADGDIVTVKGRELSEFRWDLEGANLVSTGAVENKLSKVQGSIGTDGTYSKVVYSLEDAIVLHPNQNWLVEWKMTGPAADVTGYKKILAQYATRAEGDVSLMVHGNGQIVFGHYVGSHSQYGVVGQDVAGTHVYRLVNRIDEGGINMPYLYVDGVEVGPMNIVPSEDDTDNWAEGREIVFSSIGQTNYPITALNIEYIYVKESGATPDMHIHIWGNWEMTTEPTLDAFGEETRKCTSCDETETREIPKLVENVIYRWELEGTELVSKGNVKNELSKTTGSIGSDGTTKEVQYNIEKPILLENDKDWAVEWKMSGSTASWQKILALYGTRDIEDISIMMQGNTAATAILAIGHFTLYTPENKNTHLNYGTNELASAGINMADLHVYRLENRINEDGSNMIYLLIDGKEIGPMDYSYKTKTADTWVNGKDFTFASIGQTNYPLKGAKIEYIQAQLSGASESEEDNGVTDTGKYRWDLKNGTLVSTGEERNTATRDQGTTEDELFLQTRFSIEKPIELKHNRGWTVEWEMAGDWKIANNKLKKLFSEDGLKMTKNAEAIIIDPSGYITFGYYNGSTHLRIGAYLPETIDITAFHKYKLENRVNADGSNMVYLIVDDVEIGAMDTPNNDGITKGWLVGNDFTFGFFGVNDEYFLDGGLINYIAVDEAREDDIEEPVIPEEPTEVRIKYRWELNADKNDLVSVTPFGYTENALTNKVGSISGGVTNNLQYKFTTPVVLDHTKPWTVEWNMSGSNSDWQKILVTQANALAKTDYCVMLKGETLSLGKYVSGHINYNGPSGVAAAGISLADQHTYKLENRINADNSNTVYLWVDNVEYGPLTNSSASWLPGTDITFNYIGQQKALSGTTSYALKGAVINYIDIDLANAPEAEQPEEPEREGTWYRWQLNEGKTELVSVTNGGYTENVLTDKIGTISGGVTKNLQYKFTAPVVLDHTKPWRVEWDMSGSSPTSNTAWQKILAGQKIALGGTENCIMVQGTKTIALSKYFSSTHHNYSAGEMSSSTIDMTTEQHKYRLENVCNEDGTNTIYLYVDDQRIGAVDNLGSNKTAWIDKADLTFNYIGQQKSSSGNYYGLTGATINYIEIYLGDAPVEESDDVFVNEKYRWDLEDNQLVSTGRVENALNRIKGSVKNGFFSSMQYSIATPVKLQPTEDWIVEWKMTLSESAGGTYSKLLTLSQGRQNGDISIMVNNGGLVFGYDNSGHTQYGANEFDASILKGEHTYRLQNVITDNANMVYLYVDNELVGPMDSSGGKTNKFITGKSIVLGFFGQEKYPMNNIIIDDVRIQESEHDHAYDSGVETTAPSCEAAGVKTFTCTVAGCNVSYTEPIAKLGHDEISHDGQSATCTEAGWVSYVTCSRCEHTTYTDIPATGHVNTTIQGKVDATEFEPGYTGDTYCNDCEQTIATGTEIPATHKHSFGENWESDVTGHWHACTCGAKDAFAEHISGGEATENVAEVCTECEYVITPKLEHVHSMIKTEAQDPTCATPGNSEYWTCSGCGKYFSNADCTVEITKDSWIIPATGAHNYATEVEDSRKPATCMATGSVTMACNCGATEDQTLKIDPNAHKDTDHNHICDNGCEVPQGEHSDSATDNNHVCDYCGEAIENGETCADNNKDHKCDVCGEELTQCADGNNDHNCDTCGGKLTDCGDADTNHKCDICGTVMNTAVAKIGDVYYGSLAEAVNAVAEGGTITLLANIDETVTVSKVLTIVKGEFSADIAAGEGYELTEGNGTVTVTEKDATPIEPVPTTNKHSVSYQVGLIEPWFLRINFFVRTAENVYLDPSTFKNYGAYAIRMSQLENANEVIANKDYSAIIENRNMTAYTKGIEASAFEEDNHAMFRAVVDKIPGMSFRFRENIYTYEMSDPIVYFCWYVDDSGLHYSPIVKKSVSELVEARKDDTAFEDHEREVYKWMNLLEKDIITHRKGENTDVPETALYTVAQSKLGTPTDASAYKFSRSRQIVLIEPWGLRINARARTAANNVTLDYSKLDDYGIVVYNAKDAAVPTSASEMLEKKDAYVFSKSYENTFVQVVDGYDMFCARYRNGIYTFELDSTVCYMFYIVVDGNYYYSPVVSDNIQSLAAERAADNSGGYKDTEQAVYRDMVALCDAVEEHRRIVTNK